MTTGKAVVVDVASTFEFNAFLQLFTTKCSAKNKASIEIAPRINRIRGGRKLNDKRVDDAIKTV